MSNEKKNPPRWYVVQEKKDGARCLVEANTPSQAFRRASEHYCVCRPATVAESIEMTRLDCDVISAPQTLEQLDIDDIAPNEVVLVATQGAEEPLSEKTKEVLGQLYDQDPLLKKLRAAEPVNGGRADNVVSHKNTLASAVFDALTEGEYDGE
jgi:hypothetical protein